MSRSSVLVAAAVLGVVGLRWFAGETRLVATDEGSGPHWTVAGSFARGGVYPRSDGTALAHSEAIGTSPLLWGSWGGDHARTGTLRSPPFEAPALLALLTTGYPAAAGNALYLVRERDGARYPLRTPSPGLRWRDDRFMLPSEFRGESVRLAAVDGATAQPGWLGVSTPRALTPAAWVLRWIEETSPVSARTALALFCLALVSRSLVGRASTREWISQARRSGVAARALAIARRGAPLLLGLVFLLHLGVLYRYAVDVPYLDEWRHLTSGLAKDFSLQWVLGRNGDERIVFTKLHTWLLYRTDGWNLRTQILQNFALYGAALIAAFLFVRRNAPHLDPALLLMFFLPSLSTIANENFQWGLGSHAHFVLLCLVASAHLAFRSRGSGARGSTVRAGTANAFAAAAFGVAAVMASPTGAASMAGLIGVLAAYWFIGSRPSPLGEGLTRTALSGRFALIVVPIGLAIASGSGGYANASQGNTPAGVELGLYWLNLVSGGFAVSSDSALLGCLWLAVVVTPWFVRWTRGAAHLGRAGAARGRTPLAPEEWAILALTVALLAGLFATSLARASLGVEEAKSSRHAELALFLLPLSAATWSSLLATRPLLKRRALGCLFALAAFASLDDWNTKPYQLQRFAGEEGVKCAALYYATPQRGTPCFTISKQPIERELTRARELGLHFYRRIEGAREPH